MEDLLPPYSDKPKFVQTSVTERDWLIIGKWAQFFAIFGFVYIGLSIIGVSYIVYSVWQFLIHPLFQLMPAMLWGLVFIAVVFLTCLVLIFFSSRHHLHFAQTIRPAIQRRDQILLLKAWKSMKNAWKMMGIYVIFLLGLYMLMLLFVGYGLPRPAYL